MSEFDGYGICAKSGTDHDDVSQRLIDDVLERMRQGWVPQGGATFQVLQTQPQATYVMLQAIVLPKNNHSGGDT